MKYLLAFFIMLGVNAHSKEIYTCKINGSTVYQGKPCAGSKELTQKVQKAQGQELSRQAALRKLDAERAARKEPRIGMSKSDAEKSTWGYPDKVNTTTTERSEFEQWVYRQNYNGPKYLHFTDGRLTSISN